MNINRYKTLEWLRKALGNPNAEFRQGQYECIEKILEQKKVLAVQRTGYGKSMIYFIATRLLRDLGKGPTLLISPLLSLMRNQIDAAQKIGIKAVTINSTNLEEENIILEAIRCNNIDLLIISPERLNKESFKNNFVPLLSNTGLLVIDEAHCISDWGHDFRPDYKRIVKLLKNMPSNISVLATTATANKRVIDDIKQQLGDDLFIQRGELTRKNLKLQNIYLPQKASRMAWLAQTIPLIKGSGIIYTLTQHDSKYLAEWLKSKNIQAEAYYATLETETKKKLEDELINNRLKVLVATVALGMGFDKTDLAFVIHFQRPSSVVSYYQQVGRAGRGSDEAYGILLHGKEDDEIAEYFFKSSFPPAFCVEKVLSLLKDKNGLSLNEIQKDINISQSMLQKTLNYLMIENDAPIAQEGNKYYATINAGKYKYNKELVDKIINIRRNEQQQMKEYTNYKDCLMAFLQKALDDDSYQNCEKCANCIQSPLFSEKCDSSLCNEAQIFMKRNYRTISPRKKMDGHRIPENEQAFEGRALSMWNDAGWGELVADGKYKYDFFSDELVDACIEMIDIWFKEIQKSRPQWVTCIPSLTRPKLVSDFAERLARKLNIPFIPCVEKVKNNKPQKEMENSFQQFSNVKDTFSIKKQDINPDILKKTCFLIDDVVDSRWTFTVVANLLLKSGCSGVYPLALAQNTNGE